MWWGVDVVVGVVFRVFCVQHGTWRAVCGFGAADMHRLCFPIATYLMCMDMGSGAGTPPVVRLGGSGLRVCELPHTSSMWEAKGTRSRCVGGECACLPWLSPCFLKLLCVVSARMCSGGNLMWWVWRGGVFTWWWGSFSLGFVCKTGLDALCAELVPQMCNIYVF
jgi:hypothetical protein